MILQTTYAEEELWGENFIRSLFVIGTLELKYYYQLHPFPKYVCLSEKY